NIGGVLGGYVAHQLLSLLGYGAWSVLALGGIFAWKLAGRSLGGIGRMFGWTGLLWTFLCASSLLMPTLTAEGYYAGGMLGHSTVVFLSWIIGPAGAWLMITCCALVLSLLVAGFDLSSFTNRWISRIETAGPSVGKQGMSFGAGLLRSMQDFSEQMRDKVRSRSNEDDEESVWEDDTDWYSRSQYTDDGLEVDTSNSLPPSSPFVDEELEESFFGTFPDEVASYEDEQDFTKTKIQDEALVEVSWDPTVASDPGVADKLKNQTRRRRKRFQAQESQSAETVGKDYSIEEPALSMKVRLQKQEYVPEVSVEDQSSSVLDEDISIWYQPSEPDIREEEALNDLLNELDQESSLSDPSSVFESLEVPSVPAPARKRERAKPTSQQRKTKVERNEPAQMQVSQSVVSESPIEEAIALEEDPRPKKKTRASKEKTSSKSKQKKGGISLPELPVGNMQEDLPKKPLSKSRSEKQSVKDDIKVQPGNLVSGGKIDVEVVNPFKDFPLPSLSLLDEHAEEVAHFDEKELQRLAVILEERLADFSVRGEVMAIRPGPVITTFEFKPARGIKVSKISGLSDDIAMALMAVRVRIVAPIPGKDVVGIEIPNTTRQVIWAMDMMGSDDFQHSKGSIPIVLGKSVEGLPVVSDLAKMPHLLVGGTTGSGKSVGINTMLMSMLYKHSPETLRLILIDPKMLEFEMYHDIPHLLHPVITDPHLATGILQWACDEMDSRYALMAKFKTRTIGSFNKRLEKELKDWTPEKARELAPLDWDGVGVPPVPKKMPYIVIVIDELADLMMVAGKDVESSIIRIAQKARACGIHLIVATQRPSVDVITGMIKANMPCRISFQVRQRTDSRTILDQNGGENLLGKGDMLFLPPGIGSLVRCHGPFVSDDEVRRVTDFLRALGAPVYEAKVQSEAPVIDEAEDKDDMYDLALEYVAEMGKASTSMIQRKFKIGYNRAARIIDMMEEEGAISGPDGSKPRKVFVSPSR
ncbi:MAG: DNA translocase FtsK 4TM domain-containing protein, partial [Myxococcota bacterium]|nr:DNA translocase FtsK 4TM domain-containing protein [Myxococcota bacterium]